MEERRWEDLEMDCLVNVLGRVGMESLLLDVPFVCKSWHRATLNPLCWKCLEFPHAFDSRSYSSFNFIDRFKEVYGIKELSDTTFIKFIVDRSCEHTTKLVLPNICTEEALKYAAEKCPSLEILGLPLCLFCDKISIISEIIGKWKNLEGLILGIDTIFRNYGIDLRTAGAYIGEEQSSAIVNLFPNIKYLDISWATVDRESLIMILQGCKQLKYLNASNCRSVEIDDEILKLASHITTFKYQASKARVPWSLNLSFINGGLEVLNFVPALVSDTYLDIEHDPEYNNILDILMNGDFNF